MRLCSPRLINPHSLEGTLHASVCEMLGPLQYVSLIVRMLESGSAFTKSSMEVGNRHRPRSEQKIASPARLNERLGHVDGLVAD